MIFLCLILGHLLADFVFQPQSLVIWKNKSWKGVSVHALIHLLIETLLLLPLLSLSNVFLVIIGIATLHFIIDRIKIYFEHKKHRYVVLFFLDQAAHLFVLILGGIFLQPFVQKNFENISPQWFYHNPTLAIYLIFAILVSMGIEVVGLQFLLEKNDSAKLSLNFIKIFERLAFFTILYIASIYLIFNFLPF